MQIKIYSLHKLNYASPLEKVGVEFQQIDGPRCLSLLELIQ